MNTDHQSEAERMFYATLLDQNRQSLERVRVLVMPSQEEGSIFLLSDVDAEHLCNNAEFLRDEKGSTAPIFHLRFCTTSGDSHIHFSYIKGRKDYEH
jgi:hypothetical protein